MNAVNRRRPALVLALIALALALTAGMVSASNYALAPAAQPNDNFTLHLTVPHGARIDYVRLFFYDASSANSSAWLTSYNAQGAFSDIASVNSSGTAGYGSTLSAYIGHIVNTENNAYVLNWRANQLGRNMRLCGLRVAYRLPVGAGWSSFYYFFAAGSSSQPRDSETPWSYAGAGCIFVPYHTFLPLIMRN